MKKFCKDLKEHATKIINYEKQETIPLAHKENNFYKKQKVCYICKKKFSTDDDDHDDDGDDDDEKIYHNLRDHCQFTGKYMEAAHNICNLRYNHFIIKELAKEFEGQFKYLGENTEKYTNSVPIKKELDNGKSITYKLKFIESFRFMSSSLSNLVGNLSERDHSDKCTYCKSCLDYMSGKDDQLIFKCPKCNKNHNNYFNNGLINRFASTYEFCNEDINKFILVLRNIIAK